MTRYLGLPGTEEDAKRILAAHGSIEGTGGTPQSKPPGCIALALQVAEQGWPELSIAQREAIIAICNAHNELVAALRNIAQSVPNGRNRFAMMLQDIANTALAKVEKDQP